jgi:hypothetical protein
MVFIPRNPKVYNALDRLTINNGTWTDFNTAKELSRYKQIRNIRAKDLIYIGMDRRKNKSVIVVTKTLKKKGKGFLL